MRVRTEAYRGATVRGSHSSHAIVSVAEGSYPETTGYIISTFLRYARFASDADSLERAGRMTDWEVSIQLEDGGFQGGIFGASDAPEFSTFVTGQVLFGLVAADLQFRDSRYCRAAVRAGDYLLQCLDGSGRFFRGGFAVPRTGTKGLRGKDGFGSRGIGSSRLAGPTT